MLSWYTIIETGESAVEQKSMLNAINVKLSHFPRIQIRIYMIYKRILWWYLKFREKMYVKRAGLTHIPPENLRDRVHGSTDIISFLNVGKQCSKDIKSGLMKIDKDLGSFSNILDFGCGCGRTLIWLANNSEASNFYGTDIDADAISWGRNNLKFGSFSVNNPLPPLEYPSETFDLIYAISILTHLDEEYQFRWLSELKRITKPKGILILTIHGYHCWKDIDEEAIAILKEAGILFVPVNAWQGIFPDCYQLTFHTKEYVLERYAEYFDILDYTEKGMNNQQEMVILQKI